jgi:hypothetical protein
MVAFSDVWKRPLSSSPWFAEAEPTNRAAARAKQGTATKQINGFVTIGISDVLIIARLLGKSEFSEGPY